MAQHLVVEIIRKAIADDPPNRLGCKAYQSSCGGLRSVLEPLKGGKSRHHLTIHLGAAVNAAVNLRAGMLDTRGMKGIGYSWLGRREARKRRPSSSCDDNQNPKGGSETCAAGAPINADKTISKSRANVQNKMRTK